MNRTALRYDCLDLLRGCAALLVLAGHLRAYVFQNFAEASSAGEASGLLVKAFYFVTSLGHQAVIVFFALSGFLVGGKALDDILARRFSWPRYLLRRLTRLWIVIIPALLLTLILDRVALGLGAAGYDGRFYEIYASGPRADAPISHSLLTWVGNLAFLQTILVPCFGSNGPLWSLANEFWYYVVFPLGAWLVAGRSGIAARLAGVAVLTALVAFLPYWLLTGGLVWVAGAGAAWISRWKPAHVVVGSQAAMIAAIGVACASLILARLEYGLGDVGLGLGIALALPALAHLSLPRSLAAASRAGSEISFTLYVTHFPLLTAIAMTSFAPARWHPGSEGAALYAGLLALAIAVAATVWWCFERNTDRLYYMLSRRLGLMRHTVTA